MAIEEKQKDTDLFTRFQGNSQWLQELCAMKGVEYDLMDELASIKRLYTVLQAAIAAGGVSANPYESVAAQVIEKSRLFLRVIPAKKGVEHPTAESGKSFRTPSHAHVCLNRARSVCDCDGTRAASLTLD